MEIKHILSTELPDMHNSVKERINSGMWTLFKTYQTDLDKNVVYYLKNLNRLYDLNERGKVIKIEFLEEATVPSMDELIYFSDMPSPESISERRYKKAVI